MTFHSQTLRSALPAARIRPSGLNVTELTTFAGPVRGEPSRVGWAGSVVFHSQTLRSTVPAARVRPSGLKATDSIPAEGPVRGRPSKVWRAPLAEFHSQISLPPALARIRPSGLYATESMPVGPGNGLDNGLVAASSSNDLLLGVGLIWLAATSSSAESDWLVAASWLASTVTWFAIAWSRCRIAALR